jgi:hypothetical protein
MDIEKTTPKIGRVWKTWQLIVAGLLSLFIGVGLGVGGEPVEPEVVTREVEVVPPECLVAIGTAEQIGTLTSEVMELQAEFWRDDWARTIYAVRDGDAQTIREMTAKLQARNAKMNNELTPRLTSLVTQFNEAKGVCRVAA